MKFQEFRAVYCPLDGLPFGKNKRGDPPKADESYTPAPAMVHVNKPAHCRETAFTDKTGGCNNEASVGERMCIDWPAREPGCMKSNRWC